ncbi:hypothetical protein glysoja_029777 [Glycine soja]|uniref:DUF8039 domain-containing protein n=1 Tax=Glycine soja TaxID=3848 RepID=A0A0B2QY44_GLYSO|nr:hypothetical protein glysoja_029777 [Glycine soja]
MDIMQKDLDEIKTGFSQMQTQQSTPVQPANPNVLLARVSTKESCAEAVTNVVVGDPSAVDKNTMGLYVVCGDSKHLVAVGKVYQLGGMIHNVPYADEVVRVSMVTVYDGDARVPIPTPEIEYVREAMNTFIGWPTNLVKPFFDDSNQNVRKPEGRVDQSNVGVAKDPLGEIMKILYEVYMNPVELPSQVFKHFYTAVVDDQQIVNVIHLWYNDCIVFQIGIWMSVLQAEVMAQSTTRGDGSVYGFLEPQSIHIGKEDRQQCQLYIETWVKESQQRLYLGAYLRQSHWQLFVLCPMENMVVWFCSLRKKPDVAIKAVINSHVQSGGYECGYYVMHWMWCIVNGGLKDDWNKVEELEKEIIESRDKIEFYCAKMKELRANQIVDLATSDAIKISREVDPTDNSVTGKWTMGSAIWWRKLPNLCCGSYFSPYQWTHNCVGYSSIWCSKGSKPCMSGDLPHCKLVLLVQDVLFEANCKVVKSSSMGSKVPSWATFFPTKTSCC